jgi:hypothetical protein
LSITVTVRVAGQRLVDGIVDHLIDHVMQARAVIRIPDIHAGALAHRIEALEHLDAVGAVFVGNGIFAIGHGVRISGFLVGFVLAERGYIPKQNGRLMGVCGGLSG